jgi:predicted nucleic acid-binding protein
MILLDTNVLIDAQNETSPFFEWSTKVVSEAVTASGAAINAVIMAELCAGKETIGELLERELHQAGIQLLDLPLKAAATCGIAYRKYRSARSKSAGGFASPTPLPDFFIGAHAELMGWKLATRDSERFQLYFPTVQLIQPT